jgi:DNA methyltransferase 1-associated protein 1
MKAKLGMRRVRPWKWMTFTNPARKDGLVLHHWRRATDEGKEYAFARSVVKKRGDLGPML